MGKLEEYIRFLERVQKELKLKNSINEVMKDLKMQNNFLTYSFKDFNCDVEEGKVLFLELIEQLKKENIDQEELDVLIKENEEKSKAVYDERIGMFSERIKKDLSKKLPNKLFFNSDLKKEIKPTYKIEFTKPLEFEAAKKMITSPKKISAKWYALHYLLEVEAKGLKIPVNSEGSFVRSKIEEIGKERAGGDGQSFYRQVLKYKDDIKDNSKLVGGFGKDWKKEIISLSDNDQILKDYLDKNY